MDEVTAAASVAVTTSRRVNGEGTEKERNRKRNGQGTDSEDGLERRTVEERGGKEPPEEQRRRWSGGVLLGDA